jgi:hypothetical protein
VAIFALPCHGLPRISARKQQISSILHNGRPIEWDSALGFDDAARSADALTEPKTGKIGPQLPNFAQLIAALRGHSHRHMGRPPTCDFISFDSMTRVRLG